ncbi:MAG: hypothetical protein O2894_02620 [Planctomycetota bacterium]|nr:hypothetical protein [Planctomycetota bacterium]
MRSLLVLGGLLIGGLAVWFLIAEDAPPSGPAWHDADTPPPAGSSERAKPRTIAEAPAVGVFGADARSLPPIEFGEAMRHMLRFDPAAKGVTGATWLAALEQEVGRELPIRFISQASLDTFRATDLLTTPPPAELDLPATLEWLRQRGFATEQREGFLLIRPERP